MSRTTSAGARGPRAASKGDAAAAAKGKAKAKAKTKAKAKGKAEAKAQCSMEATGGAGDAAAESGVRSEASTTSLSVSRITAQPQLTPEILKAAHEIIDLAKEAKWADVFKVLDVQRELVNVRPEVREYSVLHQAAFHGDVEAAVTLIEKYGADPAQRTKSGLFVEDVANEQGFPVVAEAVSACLVKGRVGTTGTKACAMDLTPEKLPGGVKRGSSKVTVPDRTPSGGVTPLPEKLTPEMVKAAHSLIDLAKDGEWETLYHELDLKRHLVNVRPAVREYSILHQAAFLGDIEAVNVLIDRYGADPERLSKSGASVQEVAEERGHDALAAKVAERLFPGGFSGAPESTGAEDCDIDDDDLPGLVQMPDGTWKVVAPKSSTSGPATVATAVPEAARCDSPPPSKKARPTPSEPAAAPPELSPTAAATAPAATATATAAVASTAVSAEGVDAFFPDAAAYRLLQQGGSSAWACKLRRGKTHVCVMQVLEKLSGGEWRVWIRWGPDGSAGQNESLPFESAEVAVAAFEAKFRERTNNSWASRAAFKPFFGKYVLAEAETKGGSASSASVATSSSIASSAATPTPPPAVLSDDVVKAAHALLDLAKEGKWKELYANLDGKRQLVNVRPDVRGYGLLHQAAYHGNQEAVDTLVDKYGADLRHLTKHGQTAAEVAEEQGHARVADALSLRLKAAVVRA